MTFDREKYMKEYRKKPEVKQRMKESDKRYREKNKEKIREKDKEYSERYYEKNREKILKRMEKNRSIVVTKKMKCKNCDEEFIWSSSQPNQIYCSKECQKEFYQNKVDKMKKGIMVTGNGRYHNFYRLRFEIFKRDNFTCQYCGRNVREDGIKLHCDHIIPKSKGGQFVSNNLIASCEECNLGKRDILLSEKKLLVFEENQEIERENGK